MKRILPLITILIVLVTAYATGQTASLSITPPVQTLNQARATYVLKVAVQGNFSSSLYLSARCATLPGATITITPGYINAPYTDSALMTISLHGPKEEGTHTIIVEAKNGPLRAVDSCTVQVNGKPAWKIFNTSNSPLTSNHIVTLEVDRLGRGWIFTKDGRLFMYDGTNWTAFSRGEGPNRDSSKTFPYPSHSYAHWNRTSIAIDSTNGVWISNGGIKHGHSQSGPALALFRNGRWLGFSRWARWISAPKDRRDTLINGIVRQLWEEKREYEYEPDLDYRDTLICKDSLIRKDTIIGDSLEFVNELILLCRVERIYASPGIISHEALKSMGDTAGLGDMVNITTDIHGNLWVCQSRRITRLNTNDSNDWESWEGPVDGQKFSTLYGIAVDHNNHIWLGAADRLYKYDGTYWTSVLEGPSMWAPPVGLHLTSNMIEIDKLNRPWIISNNGWLNIDGDLVTFHQGVDTVEPAAFPGLVPISIDFDDRGIAWVATGASGLIKFDGMSTDQYTVDNSGLPTEALTIVRAGLDNAIWIGTKDGGLAILDGNQSGHNIASSVTTGESVTGKVSRLLNDINPNPAGEMSFVRFTTEHRGIARLTLIDQLGEQVGDAIEREVEPGTHTIAVNLRDIPPGSYLVRLSIGNIIDARPIIVIR